MFLEYRYFINLVIRNDRYIAFNEIPQNKWNTQ